MRLLQVLVMLTVLLGGNFYVFYRLWQMMPPVLIGRILLVTAAVVVLVSPFLSMGFGGSFPSELSALMYKVGTSWIIVFMYLFILFLLFDLIRITHLLPVKNIMYHSWLGLGVVAIGMIALLSVGYYRYTHKTRVDISVATGKEPVKNHPLKIVAVSDLHLGYGIGKEEFEGWVQLINRENPDIVLIAGDITDNNVVPLYEQDMASVFGKIQSRYGTYAVLGNHEYIGGIKRTEAFLATAGVTVLKDSIACVDDRFYVVGRDDRSNPNRKSLQELCGTLDKSKPVIMLDHQPYHLEEAEYNGVDLQFSGHTHGGQVWPISLVTHALFEKDHGYLKKGNTHYYISSGLGIWGGKFRIGTQSEYVVITLQ